MVPVESRIRSTFRFDYQTHTTMLNVRYPKSLLRLITVSTRMNACVTVNNLRTSGVCTAR